MSSTDSDPITLLTLAQNHLDKLNDQLRELRQDMKEYELADSEKFAKRITKLESQIEEKEQEIEVAKEYLQYWNQAVKQRHEQQQNNPQQGMYSAGISSSSSVTIDKIQVDTPSTQSTLLTEGGKNAVVFRGPEEHWAFLTAYIRFKEHDEDEIPELCVSVARQYCTFVDKLNQAKLDKTRDAHHVREEVLTCEMASCLQVICGDICQQHNLGCCHQAVVGEKNCTTDFGVWIKKDTEIGHGFRKFVLTLEAKASEEVDTGSKAFKQVQAQVTNSRAFHDESMSRRPSVMMTANCGTFRVFGVRQRLTGDQQVQVVCELFSWHREKTDENNIHALTKLFHVLQQLLVDCVEAESIETQEEEKLTDLDSIHPIKGCTRLSENAVLQHEVVYKFYGNVGGIQCGEEAWRLLQERWQWYQEWQVATEYGITELQYPYKDNDDNGITETQFQDIVDQVQMLHDNDIVHGDIRIANLIFDGEHGYLIDFDFAGKQGEASYPAGLNPDVPRHEGAKSSGWIQKEHDEWMLEKCRKELFGDEDE